MSVGQCGADGRSVLPLLTGTGLDQKRANLSKVIFLGCRDGWSNGRPSVRCRAVTLSRFPRWNDVKVSRTSCVHRRSPSNAAIPCIPSASRTAATQSEERRSAAEQSDGGARFRYYYMQDDVVSAVRKLDLAGKPSNRPR